MSAYEQLADESLLDFIAAADEGAFAELLRRYHTRFYRAAYRWVLHAEDAQDIVQQAFLKLWSGSARFKRGKGASFSTWFYRIVHNQAMDVLRARKESFTELHEEIAPSGDDLEADLAAWQQQQALRRCLLQLPENQRIAVQLFYFEELKQKDIAPIMGISVKALESLLIRARQQLREQLNPLPLGALNLPASQGGVHYAATS